MTIIMQHAEHHINEQSLLGFPEGYYGPSHTNNGCEYGAPFCTYSGADLDMVHETQNHPVMPAHPGRFEAYPDSGQTTTPLPLYASNYDAEIARRLAMTPGNPWTANYGAQVPDTALGFATNLKNVWAENPVTQAPQFLQGLGTNWENVWTQNPAIQTPHFAQGLATDLESVWTADGVNQNAEATQGLAPDWWNAETAPLAAVIPFTPDLNDRAASMPKESEWTPVCGVVSPDMVPPGAAQPYSYRENPKWTYSCPRCHMNLSRRFTVKTHFPRCIKKYGNPQGLTWSSHKSIGRPRHSRTRNLWNISRNAPLATLLIQDDTVTPDVDTSNTPVAALDNTVMEMNPDYFTEDTQS